ncbi:MAG: hypothetical protein NWE89_05165 [Candidatus Bathyarchaeota archaeon]|nr:hypothetical protein [Candidatus Bathyarchaeota archaeon]
MALLLFYCITPVGGKKFYKLFETKYMVKRVNGLDVVVDLNKNFKHFGLTDYEARTYVALLSLTKGTANEIVELTGIPHSKIYFVLNNLEKKGWVVVQRGRPSFYKAVPAKYALSIAKDRIVLKLQNAENEIIKELSKLSTSDLIAEKGELWTIRGFNNVVRKVEDLITNAESEIFMGFTTENEGFLRVFKDRWARVLKVLSSQGVEVKIMLAGVLDVDDAFLESFGDLVQLRWVNSDDYRFMGIGVVVDNSEVVFGGFRTGKDLSTWWSDEKGFVFMLKEMLEIRWQESTNILT